MSKYKEHFVVMSHDTDANNLAKPSVVARLFQETANHHMRDRRPSYYELFFSGKSFIAIRMAFEMKEQLHPYDEVDVYTWTAEGKGATFFRCYSMERDGKEVARAYSEWTVTDLNENRLCHRDEIDFSAYETDELVTLNAPVKFHFPRDMEFEKCGEYLVEYCDTDMNGHMNNTIYQNIIWNHVPDVAEKKLTSFSLRYMAEAPLGSVMEIYRAKLDEHIYDSCGAEESYYFKTVVNGRVNTASLVSAAKTERYIV